MPPGRLRSGRIAPLPVRGSKVKKSARSVKVKPTPPFGKGEGGGKGRQQRKVSAGRYETKKTFEDSAER